MTITAQYINSKMRLAGNIHLPDIDFTIVYTPYMFHVEKTSYICNVDLENKTATVLTKTSKNESVHRHRSKNNRAVGEGNTETTDVGVGGDPS